MTSHVLVVDDHPLVRDVLRKTLEARGFLVSTAQNGEEAQRLFDAAPPDLALIDMDMPGANGVEVCRALRAAAGNLGRTLPVWIITGVERSGLEKRAREAGAHGVLAKPFSGDQLVARINLALGRVAAPPRAAA